SPGYSPGRSGPRRDGAEAGPGMRRARHVRRTDDRHGGRARRPGRGGPHAADEDRRADRLRLRAAAGDGACGRGRASYPDGLRPGPGAGLPDRRRSAGRRGRSREARKTRRQGCRQGQDQLCDSARRRGCERPPRPAGGADQGPPRPLRDVGRNPAGQRGFRARAPQLTWDQPKSPMTHTPLLDKVNSPADVRTLAQSDLHQLADELRAETIEAVSQTGGHLGAGLGVVELTVALHHVYNTPRDILIWDVGHQAYPHKILTGRRSRIRTLRQGGGLSGFTKRAESDYDPFGAAHAATSISAAL